MRGGDPEVEAASEDEGAIGGIKEMDAAMANLRRSLIENDLKVPIARDAQNH